MDAGWKGINVRFVCFCWYFICSIGNIESYSPIAIFSVQCSKVIAWINWEMTSLRLSSSFTSTLGKTTIRNYIFAFIMPQSKHARTGLHFNNSQILLTCFTCIISYIYWIRSPALSLSMGIMTVDFVMPACTWGLGSNFYCSVVRLFCEYNLKTTISITEHIQFLTGVRLHRTEKKALKWKVV